ncbi:unnamed protein product, partial [Oikopleura dioica]
MSNGESKAGAEIPQLDISQLCKQILPVTVGSIRSSSSLPSAGESYDFYQTYPAFTSFQRRVNDKIMKIVTDLNALHGRATKREPLPDDLVESMLEANDQILEGVGNKLDEASGINKDAGPIMPDGQITNAKEKIIAASWNRRSTSTIQDKSKMKSAETISKPQLLFREKPDNTIIPFVPRLFEKPHANKPLPEQLVNVNSDRHKTGKPLSMILKELGTQIDTSIYSHPYEEEIKSCGVPSASDNVTEYKALDDTPLSVVESSLSFNLMIQELREESELAVDLEHHRYRSYQGFTCLVQISSRQKDYILDPLAVWEDMYKLNEVFANPKIVKIFHGSRNDMLWLQRDFGVYVVNLFDTFFAAKKLDLAKKSLDYLLQHYCKIRLDKRFQLADWRMRPIPPNMLRYARQDTHYLLYVYDRLRADLEKLEFGATREIFRLSREFSLSKYEKPIFGESDYKKLYESKNRKKFNNQQLKALELLYAWRDQIARFEDESTDYVIPNHILLQVSEILPREQQGILACFSYQPVIVKQHLHLLHKLIKRARETPLVADEDPAELSLNNIFIQENEEDELHDIKEESGESGIEEDIVPIKVRTSSAMSAVFNFSNDQPPSKKQISKEVNDTFADPLNEHSIPYQLYLRPQKVEAIDSEEKSEKIWKVRPAAPLKEEKEEVNMPTMPERKTRDSNEDKI